MADLTWVMHLYTPYDQTVARWQTSPTNYKRPAAPMTPRTHISHSTYGIGNIADVFLLHRGRNKCKESWIRMHLIILVTSNTDIMVSLKSG